MPKKGETTVSVRDRAMAATVLPTESVTVPEWECDVLMQSMTARAKDAFEKGIHEDGLVNFRARLVIACALDPETEEPAFTEDDLDWLGDRSASAVSRLYDVAAKLNGVSAADADELEKN